MESGLVRLQLSAATDLQTIRHGLFRDSEADVGARIHHVPLQVLLVASAGWQPSADVLSARLCGWDRCGTDGQSGGTMDAFDLRLENPRQARDDAPVWRWRSRRRADSGHARSRRA